MGGSEAKKIHKRIEALSEMFYSEKAYLYDLRLWMYDLQLMILRIKSIPPERRYRICRSIFFNVDKIYELHRRIFKGMKEKNREIMRRYPLLFPESVRKIQEDVFKELGNVIESFGQIPVNMNASGSEEEERIMTEAQVRKEYQERIQNQFLLKKEDIDTSDLEYASLIIKEIEDFQYYEGYVSRLPKAQYEFESLHQNNIEFGSVVDSFLSGNNIKNLGPKHFFLRPITKLQRYPLLLKAILKNESGKNQDLYTKAIEKIKEVAKRIEKISSIRDRLFNVFLISERLELSEEIKKHTFLTLTFKDIHMLTNSRVLIQDNKSESMYYRQAYVYNRFITLCDVSNPEKVKVVEPVIYFSQIIAIRNDPPGYIRDESLPKSIYPIHIVFPTERKKKTLYFDDYYTREFFFQKVSEGISKVRRKIRKAAQESGMPRIVEELAFEEEPVLCVTKGRPLEESLKESAADLNLDIGPEEDPEYLIKFDFISSDEKKEKDDKDLKEEDKRNEEERKNELNDEKRINFLKNKQKIPGPIEDTNIRLTTRYLKESKTEKFFEGLEGLLESSECSDWTSYSWSEVLTGDPTKDASFYKKNHMIYDEVSDSSSVYSEVGVMTFSNTFSCFCGVFGQTDAILKDKVVFQRDSMFSGDMLVYSTPNGIFKLYNGHPIKISNDTAKKIVYDSERSLVFYTKEYTLNVASLNTQTEWLNPTIITINVKTFFYERSGELQRNRNDDDNSDLEEQLQKIRYKVEEGAVYLVVFSPTKFNPSMIYIFTILDSVNQTYIVFSRKLYVGFDIIDVSFSGKKMVIASKDFQIIEIDTFFTQRFLNFYDQITSVLYSPVSHMNAIKMFRISKKTLFLCFDGCGFYVDAYGRFKYTQLLFVWENTMREFRIWGKKIFCLSSRHLSVFLLESAQLIFRHYGKNMRFVSGTREPIFYDNSKVYRYCDNSPEDVQPSATKLPISLSSEDVFEEEYKSKKNSESVSTICSPEFLERIAGVESEDHYAEHKGKTRKGKIKREALRTATKRDGPGAVPQIPVIEAVKRLRKRRIKKCIRLKNIRLKKRRQPRLQVVTKRIENDEVACFDGILEEESSVSKPLPESVEKAAVKLDDDHSDSVFSILDELGSLNDDFKESGSSESLDSILNFAEEI